MVLLDREQGRRMVALAYKTPEDTAGPCGAEAQILQQRVSGKMQQYQETSRSRQDEWRPDTQNPVSSAVSGSVPWFPGHKNMNPQYKSAGKLTITVIVFLLHL
jgi:hypothetical protein